MFCLSFPLCKFVYKEGVLLYIFYIKNMFNLGWANEKGLTLKAKPKIKLKYLHIYFLVYLPT
jgi:hypothetical protein